MSGELLTKGIIRIPEGHSAEFLSDIIPWPYVGQDRLLGADWVTVGVNIGVVLSETCPELELFDVYPPPKFQLQDLHYGEAWYLGTRLVETKSEEFVEEFLRDIDIALSSSSSLTVDHEINAFLLEK